MKKTNFLIDFFFPKYCLNCQELNAWLCQPCFGAIKLAKTACFICQQANQSGQICPLCRYYEGEKAHTWLLDHLIWATSYKEKPLQKLIIALKYGGVLEIADILGDILNKKIKTTWPKTKAYLIPIPSSTRQIKKRGYNPAALIAKRIAEKNHNLKLNDNLIIKKAGQKQTGRKIKNRWTGLSQFDWTGQLLNKQTLIIIDDVATSGATLNKATELLKETGAKTILAATVLKG